MLSCDSFFRRKMPPGMPTFQKVLGRFLCVNANDGHFCWKSYIPGASIRDLCIISLFGHVFCHFSRITIRRLKTIPKKKVVRIARLGVGDF